MNSAIRDGVDWVRNMKFEMKSLNSDIAYRFIRKKILTGEYLPGRSLPLTRLSEEIGVSRTPVRESLRRLQADGLVGIESRLGASVIGKPWVEWRDTFELLLGLEAHAAGLAARNRDGGDLRHIQCALEEMHRLRLEGGDEESLRLSLCREDGRFHRAIVDASKNDLIKKEIRRLHVIFRVSTFGSGRNGANLQGARTASYRRGDLRRHEQIYRAIVDSESLAARLAMEGHLREILDDQLQVLNGSADRESRDQWI